MRRNHNFLEKKVTYAFFCFWGCFNFVFAFTSCSFLIFLLQWLTSYSACFQLKTILRKHHRKLDFQAIFEIAFLASHHGWISGLSIVYFDQSQPSLLESSRLSSDWSILVVTRLSNMANVSTKEFLPATKCVLERFYIDKFRETQQDVILNLLICRPAYRAAHASQHSCSF